jgi:phosphoribosylformylglycinamidine synthase
LGVHLALVASGGELGMELDLTKVPTHKDLSPWQILYSESAGRFIVTVDPVKKDAFEDATKGMKAACIGRTTDKPRFSIKSGRDRPMIEEDIFQLKTGWMEPFGDLK